MFLLKRKPKNVYLCQDTDEAGVNAIIRSDQILSKSGIRTYVLDFKPSKDVDEYINTYGVESFKKKLENPIPTFLFIVSTLKRKYNVSDPYDQEKYINEIVTMLSEVDNSFVRDNYLKKVALQENLDAGTLRDMLDLKLKGNNISSTGNIFKQYNDTKVDEKQNIKINEISKIDSSFIYLIYLLPDYKEKVAAVIDGAELSNDIYRFLYKLYLDGAKISDVYDKIESLSEEEKKIINKILNANYNYNDSDEVVIVESLNQVIRQIKIRTANNSSNLNLDSVFELNNKIMDINKTIYIK
jgi:DNA primase